MLEELQVKMENEVKEIEERYKNLRKPFLTALSERKAPAAAPSSPVKGALAPKSPGKK